MTETHGPTWPPDGPTMILLVEDDRDVRAALAAVLHDEGCDVVVAPDGFDALAAIEQHHPHVAVVDWMMPVIGGQDFLKALRSEYRRDTPVLVISAGRIDEATVRAAGGDAYLRKPFDIDELVEAIQRLIVRGPLPPDAPR